MNEEYEVEECKIGEAETKDNVTKIPIKVKTKPKAEKIVLQFDVGNKK